jgi:hypothetical protein
MDKENKVLKVKLLDSEKIIFGRNMESKILKKRKYISMYMVIFYKLFGSPF